MQQESKLFNFHFAYIGFMHCMLLQSFPAVNRFLFDKMHKQLYILEFYAHVSISIHRYLHGFDIFGEEILPFFLRQIHLRHL